MTFQEWLLKLYGLKVTKFQMPLPTMYRDYKKYCEENDVEENWDN